MGSFNVVCCVSRISISSGDPVIYIPLELSEIYENRMDGGLHHLLYPWAYYRPITLPIIGQYDGYSNVKKIPEDDSIDLIEDYFDMPISDFVNISKQPEEYIHAGCFIHKEIYKMCISMIKNDYGKNISDLRLKYSEAYNQMKVGLEEFDELYQKSMKAFLEKIPEIERSIITNALLSATQLNNPFNFTKENISHHFGKIYNPAIKQGLLKDRLIDFRMLEDSMWAFNVQYGPTAYGYQYGNDFMSRRLFQKSLEIVEKKIEEKGYDLKEEDK